MRLSDSIYSNATPYYYQQYYGKIRGLSLLDRQLSVKRLAKVIQIPNVLHFVLVAAGGCPGSHALGFNDLILESLMFVKVLKPIFIMG